MAVKDYPKFVAKPAQAFTDRMGRLMVSDHVTYNEIRCRCGLPECNLVDYSIIIDPEVLRFFEALRGNLARELKVDKVPIQINSGCRCEWHQKHLAELGYQAAKVSPHVPRLQSDGRWRSFALDLGIPKGVTATRLYNAIKATSREVRVGHTLYRDTFFHVDVAYNCIPNPAPRNWRTGVEW